MITNLLNQDVMYSDFSGKGYEYKICAIYQHKARVLLGIVDADGHIVFDVCPSSVRINHNHIYVVFLYYSPDKKIMAIKTVREITGLGLREAKDLVEANISGVKVKNNLTHSEAKEILNTIEANGLEGKIIKE